VKVAPGKAPGATQTGVLLATIDQPKTADFSAPLDAHLSGIAGDAEGGLGFFDFAIALAKRKRFLVRFITVATVAAIALAFLLPRRYSANTKIMPPQTGQSTAMAMLGQLGQLGPLLGTAGSSMGIRNSSDLYIYMLRSRTVSDDIIQRFSLMQVYKKKRMKDARKKLEDYTDITAGKEGGIAISVEDGDAQRAADIANAYVQELQDLTKTLAVTEAGRRRLFFEREMEKSRDDLTKAEQDLEQTQLKTGMIQLDSQSKAMLEAFMSLRAQVAAKEAQIESMRSFATPENPDLQRAQNELAALQSQVARFERGQGGAAIGDVALEKVPGAGLEYLRRYREVKYREALFELLAKQYEIARIDEAKDAFIIQVLDKGVRPETQLRTWPIRVAMAVLLSLFAAIIAVVLAFLAEKLEHIRQTPQYSAGVGMVRIHLSR
jgi:uncharacterized protein involved in exopolysaccharide biosynthesis